MSEQPAPKKSEERLSALNFTHTSQRNDDGRYTRFIRRARLILPVIALIIAAVVLSWSSMKPEILSMPSIDGEVAVQDISKNELLETRFESRDQKDQPFTITATRAVQDQRNENVINLEKPLADMLLNSGQWIAIEAQDGQFTQDTQTLFLENDVRLFHDKGYQMETQSLNVDLENNTAKTQDTVYAQGPRGTLQAMGMDGDADLEFIKFIGPAKLIISRSVSDINEESTP